jgi:antitoxin component YwqK of YwqJK toxin-antitoxin module
MRQLLIATLLCAVVACTQKQRATLIVSKDERGILTSEIYYINDSIKHGLARYYFENGRIQREVEFVNGNREGWDKRYKPNGILERKTYFIGGVAEGEDYVYYDDGTVNTFQHFNNGSGYGSTYFYYPNGKLETYRCTDFFGDVIYVVKWNTTGEKVKEAGVVFSRNFYIDGVDSTAVVRVNQDVAIQVTVAEPPDTKASISMGLITGDGKRKYLEVLSIGNNTANYTHRFSEIGSYDIVTIGELKNKNGSLVRRDSAKLILQVVANEINPQ